MNIIEWAYGHNEIKKDNNITGPVTVVLGDTGVEIDNVETMIQTERPEGGGDPKSDLTFLDANKNILFHISHKDGKTAKSAQQWGGISGEMATAEGVNDFVEKLNFYKIHVSNIVLIAQNILF